MKNIIITVLLINLIASPLYAANKIGLGIDFTKKDKKSEEYEEYYEGDINQADSKETDVGMRLYFEHLVKESFGIQLEFGFVDYNFERKDSMDYDLKDGYKIELSSLLKYYFYNKNGIWLYIGGGLGVQYENYQFKSDYESTYFEYEVYHYSSKYSSTNLIEQASIGIQFPVGKKFTIFIEDRFINKISDGQLRVGLYLISSKKREERR